MGIAGTAALIGALYVALFLLERAYPLRRARAPLLRRLVANLAISALAFITAALLVQPAALAMLGYAEGRLGLIPLLGVEGPAQFVAAFLLLDLSFYYWHVANHRFGFLWRFHNVHHIDPDLDVSTAFRFHFVEVGFSAGFRALQVLLIGPSLAAYVVYEVAFQLGTLFHHSNLRLPICVERVLNLLVVTPRMHGIHHSDLRQENLSNFGVVHSFWDRLHRTLCISVPQSQVRIGIPGYSEPDDHGLLRSILIPFLAQRQYWPETQPERLRRAPAASGGGALAE